MTQLQTPSWICKQILVGLDLPGTKWKRSDQDLEEDATRSLVVLEHSVVEEDHQREVAGTCNVRHIFLTLIQVVSTSLDFEEVQKKNKLLLWEEQKMHQCRCGCGWQGFVEFLFRGVMVDVAKSCTGGGN